MDIEIYQDVANRKTKAIEIDLKDLFNGMIMFYEVFDDEHKVGGVQIKVEGVYIWPFKQLRVAYRGKAGEFGHEDHVISDPYHFLGLFSSQDFQESTWVKIWKRKHSPVNDMEKHCNIEIMAQISLVPLMQSSGIFLGCILIMYEFHKFLPFLLLLVYSFWIPQIVTNVFRDPRKPLHPYFIIGMSVTRLAIPLYIFGCLRNFMHSKPDKKHTVDIRSRSLRVDDLLELSQGPSDEKSEDVVVIIQHLLSSSEKIGEQQFEDSSNLLNYCNGYSSDKGIPLQRLEYYFCAALRDKIHDLEMGVTTSKMISLDIEEAMRNSSSKENLIYFNIQKHLIVVIL
ncbi:hypothetical protein POM88_016382 [Heracleum sosnowskyi]|uniref:RING-type E3 ubiquitin transferase n=1 Tax=Heracleum sosnowskyi TaxID=360622 RepID=A0AAD8MX25_9APIA|nr:hypothetical protein POM88_016382 [Heracleum sosnowskyi]